MINVKPPSQEEAVGKIRVSALESSKFSCPNCGQGHYSQAPLEDLHDKRCLVCNAKLMRNPDWGRREEAKGGHNAGQIS